MYKVNENYAKLPGSYLFSTIGKKVREYSAENPEKDIISLGIGDVTQPLAPAVISALHSAVDEMAHAETFKGYAPDLGYEFLRNAIVENDYKARGCDIKEMCIRDRGQSAVSHQLRLLKQMRLVTFRRDGKTVFYSLADGHIKSIISQGMEHINEER